MNKSVKLTTRVLKVCFSLTFLILFGLTSLQLQAQQNPYPFNLDLSLGGGLIGNTDANTTFQPELGFSYMPGKFGVGLNAGLLSYDPAFDAQQYTAGFEDYTSISGSGEKWSSFFFGIGPRFEFSSQLPVTFRTSLDLSLTYNSPPSVSVDFNDPDGTAPGVDLQLSGYEAGEDYSKWSAALRPEFQMQFSPGGSDRFAIQVTTGIQHRLSKNEFTYSQRDLSDVQAVPNSQEMFMQFEMAPEVQQTAQPPKTNFFTTVGIKIKFGLSKADAKKALEGGPSLASGNGDCDDGDISCSPGSRAKDYNSSRSNKPRSEAAQDDIIEIKREGLATAENYIDDIIEVLDRCEGDVCAQVRRNADGRVDITRKARQGQISQDQGIEDIHSIVMEDVVSLSKCGTGVCREVLAMEQNLLAHMNDLMGVVQTTRAQDYNAARSNKPTSRAEDVGDGDMDSDGDGIDDAVETAQETRGIDKKDIRRGEVNSDDCDDVGPCPRPDDTMFKAKELGLASVGNDISNIKQVLDRCNEGVCGQVRQHADERHHGVARALENPTEIDTHIEEILNIVKEDVESLGKCETDVCREVLVMEEQLLVKMNRLSDLAQIAPAQDYNAARSNKPTSRANDIGDEDLDSDGDGIDDAVETAKDYNSSRSNKPRSEDGRGGNDDIVREAHRLARLINPPNAIISVGSVVMAANPLYEGNTTEGESPLYEGQANDGDADNNNDDDNRVPSTVQKYDLQPSSFCMEVGSPDSQQGMRTDAQNHNSSRSNRTSGITNPDLDGDGFPEIMKSASFSISKRSARTGRNQSPIHEENNVGGQSALYEPKEELANNDGDGQGDVDGFHFELEINDPDSDGDGVSDEVEANDDDNNDGETPDEQNIDSMDIVVLVPGRAGVVQSIPVNNFDTIDNAPEEKERALLSKADAKKALDGFIRSISNNAPPGTQVAPSQVKVIVMGVSYNGEMGSDGLGATESLEVDDSGSERGGIVSDQVLKTFFQTGDKPTASVTYSISKRSARTGRSASTDNNESESMEWDGNAEKLMASDDDPCGPGVWARTTGGNANCTPENSDQENPLALESGWVETPVSEATPPNNVHQWTYNLNSLTDGQDMPGGTLTVLFTGGKWHFDVQVDHVDPDDDGDGFGDLLQNSSFSISKRSARTGRN